MHTQWKLPHTTEPLVNDFVYWQTEFISLHGQQTGGIMVEHSTESQPQLIQFCAYYKDNVQVIIMSMIYIIILINISNCKITINVHGQIQKA